jgi:hypothetical protein
MAVHDTGKVIPPQEVLVNFAEQDLRQKLQEEIAARILEEANLAAQVEEAYWDVGEPDPKQIDGLVRQHLGDQKADLWTVPIEMQSDKLLDGVGRD